jgi:hypothetical protein
MVTYSLEPNSTKSVFETRISSTKFKFLFLSPDESYIEFSWNAKVVKSDVYAESEIDENRVGTYFGVSTFKEIIDI